VADCADYLALSRLFGEVRPEAVIHLAEQPSAPYSMMGLEQARLTLNNNLNTTFNVIWAVREFAPECHIVKLGTMGEYGTPDIDIEEGWIEIEHRGRRDRFLFPRQAASLYHTTKVLDTDLLWFYVRSARLRVTDLMQGVVYGLATPESETEAHLAPAFHYDDVFGTVLNRFLAQAAAGVPLSVYGRGGQRRGYLNLPDTLQCLDLALTNQPAPGELRILNQFSEVFSVSELAERVRRAGRLLGLAVEVRCVPNPRQEAEEHYYNARHTGLLELGLAPTLLNDEVLAGMLGRVLAQREHIDPRRFGPRVRWA
jgi:UDP-sulfoquinovose synthase